MNRDDMVCRFEQWLDEALAAEDPPDGIDAEMLATMAEANADANIGPDHPGDSYTMWAAMTALTVWREFCAASSRPARRDI